MLFENAPHRRNDGEKYKYNFHLVKPPSKYRAESERQIAVAGCRTRKDSIRIIETLFTASPEFFKEETAKDGCTQSAVSGKQPVPVYQEFDKAA